MWFSCIRLWSRKAAVRIPSCSWKSCNRSHGILRGKSLFSKLRTILVEMIDWAGISRFHATIEKCCAPRFWSGKRIFFYEFPSTFSSHQNPKHQHSGAAARLEKLEGDATTSGHFQLSCCKCGGFVVWCCLQFQFEHDWLPSLDLYGSYSHTFWPLSASQIQVSSLQNGAWTLQAEDSLACLGQYFSHAVSWVYMSKVIGWSWFS